MRFLSVFLLALTVAGGAHAQGAQALAGLQNIARQLCDWSGSPADPGGLAAAIDGRLGDSMGVRNTESIIGSVYAEDPAAGAQMWASNITRRAGGCARLIGILDRPAAEVLAELG